MKKDKRIIMHLTLSQEMSDMLDKLCTETGVNKSRLIERVLTQYIEKNEK